MARVIIGGQALSLVITLLIVPVAYSLFDDAGLWLARLGKRAPRVTPQPEAAEEE
jgi:HAE1 family hydrophobic/amphiphilic exporter-1